METESTNHFLVVFTLDDRRFALRLDVVERVIPIMDIRPFPQAPEITMGVINVRGEVIPVIDIRRRFGLAPSEQSLRDQLIIAHIGERNVALVVDGVMDMIAYPEQDIVAAGNIISGAEYIDGIVKLPDGLIFIHDLNRCLSQQELHDLEQVLA